MAGARAPKDPRFAFLESLDRGKLLQFVLRLKYRFTKAEAEDVVQSAYERAMALVDKERGPSQGHQRGWFFRVTKNVALETFRERKELEPPIDLQAEPDFAAEDARAAHEEKMQRERELELAEDFKAKHPEKAAILEAPDGRKERGAPQDAAARKRRERARLVGAAFFGAALATAMVLLYFRLKPAVPVAPVAAKLAWDDRTLAAASREIAVKECAARRWPTCLDQLKLVQRLDPSAFGAREQAAQQAAIAALRADALQACERKEWDACLDGLNEASNYDDRAGDSDPLVQLARAEALAHVGGKPGRRTEPLPDSKAPFYPRR
jgi:hypothetical protein